MIILSNYVTTQLNIPGISSCKMKRKTKMAFKIPFHYINLQVLDS